MNEYWSFLEIYIYTWEIISNEPVKKQNYIHLSFAHFENP